MSLSPVNNPKTTNSVSKPGGFSIEKKFQLRHIFRGGAVVWTKHQGKDYYAVFKSLSRPNRGIQLPGGRIEKNENPARAIIRETQEEIGIQTRIVCPLGFMYYENQQDGYSNLQMYYLVRPTHPVNIFKKWNFTDKDNTKQKLECWFVSIDEPTDFLAAGQSQIINMFKIWLKEHKKPETKKLESENLDIEIFTDDEEL